MQVEQALGELGHLGDAAGDGDARHGMRAQIFEHAADEIAHVDQRDLGQAVELLHRGLRGRAGRAGDMGEARGARDVDAAMDRMDPGRAGIGHDDAGGAEDRQAADDAEPPVEGLGGERLAAGNGDLDLDVAGSPWAAAISAMASRIIWRGTGLMAGSPGGIGRPGRVTVPTPSPARKLTPLPARAAADRGEDQRAMGDVGIVAGVLDHAGGRRAVAQRLVASAKAGCCPRGRVTSTGSGNSPVSSA